MKTPEDEAFDDLAKKQGDWGGGFPAKRAMAADKLQEPDALTIAYQSGFYDGKKAALAQPAQEPVAWMTINEYGEEDDIHYENPEGHLLEGWTYKPLYTHAPTAQPAQEPFEYWSVAEGWVKIDEVREHFDVVGCGTIYKTAGEDRVPLYTAPPQRPWVGLTEDELLHIGVATGLERAAAQMIEAKLKEMNT